MKSPVPLLPRPLPTTLKTLSFLGRKFAHILADVLFPVRCAACGCFLSPGGKRTAAADTGVCKTNIRLVFEPLMGALLCDACRAAFQPVRSPLCPCCGIMFPSRQGRDHLCGQCSTAGHWFTASRAAGQYQGPLRDMLHHLKFGGRVRLARPLGTLVFCVYKTAWPTGAIDVVVPVPLHRRRFRQRGFNQAYLLVHHWPLLFQSHGAATEKPRILKQALMRCRSTPFQTGLGRSERLSNLKDAFALTPGTAVAGKSVLLVDDVMTTGTTVDACAKVLVNAGASRVDVLTLARAMV